jgi:phosphate uptake regulator
LIGGATDKTINAETRQWFIATVEKDELLRVASSDKRLERIGGALVRRSLRNIKRGFLERDEDACSAVIADDQEVDLLVKQVDKAGTSVLIRFQPLASDFRAVLATVKLGSHLENISDQAVDIARTSAR